MSALKKDANSGRVLFLDSEENDITAEEFLQFMKEGFVPVIKTVNDNGVQFAISGYAVNTVSGVVTVGSITLSPASAE